MSEQDLRRHVLNRAAECVGLIAFEDGLLAQAEVSEFDMANRVEKNVLRLQISVNDAFRVQVLQREQDLGQVEAGHVLHEDALALQLHEQLTATQVLEDQIQFAVGLKGVDQVNNKWVLFGTKTQSK